jgi:Xaa-Pro aminopeptidase
MRMAFGPRIAALVDASIPAADAVLVSALVNVRYLTGFTGSNGAVLVVPGSPARLATDGRYALQAGAESPDADVIVTRSPAAELVRAARALGVARLAVEHHQLTVEQHDRLRSEADGVELVDGGRVVETLRAVKDAAELSALERACRITDEAFAAVLSALRPGVTEREVAWQLLVEFHRHGADGPAFDSIVAFGDNSAEPHHRPTDRPLAAGDLVKLDFGALVDGYHADLTRTVVLGPPAGWQRELHDLVASVQSAAVTELAPGAVPADLDVSAKARIAEGGAVMAHGLGHGVGLEIHEAPLMVPGVLTPTLAAGMVVTVEPGAYVEGRGGVRIEDTVALIGDGVRSLTTSPRELLEV